MRKDPTQFRERFNRWKQGEQVYSQGLPVEDDYYDYIQKLAKKKSKDWKQSEDETLIRMLNDNEYNYKTFYDNDRKMANAMLTADKNVHFTDIGKTVYHPTFSNESLYSGKKSDYNPRGTVGGTWSNNDAVYNPSKSQIINKDFNYDYTRWYLDRDEEDGGQHVDIKLPKFDDGLSQQNNESTSEILANTAISFVPILGTLNEARQFAQNPSWEQAGWTAMSLAGEVFPLLKGFKAAKNTLKAAEASLKVAKSAHRANQIAYSNRIAKNMLQIGTKRGKATRDTMQHMFTSRENLTNAQNAWRNAEKEYMKWRIGQAALKTGDDIVQPIVQLTK